MLRKLTSRRSLIPSGTSWNLFLLLFFLLAFHLSPAQNSGTRSEDEAIVLEAGKSIERELAGAQRHKYRILLSVNQYSRVVIEQRGIDVTARLSRIDGQVMADFDAEMRPQGTETIEFAASADGPYEMVVSARYPLLNAGKYEIRLAEMRAATAQDLVLQEARNLHAASIRLYNAGKYQEAEKLAQQAIEIRQRELGPEQPLTASSLTHLARIVDAQGKYDEAEQINQRVLAIREKILGADHPDVGYTLNYLALNASHKEDFQRAIDFHRRALAVREKNFGLHHPIVAVSVINLGVVYDALGDKLRAGELYERALKIQEHTVGPENLNTAVILNNIGKIYNDVGEYKKAEPFLVRAAAILEKLLAPDNPRIYDSLTNLAETYAGLGDLDRAEALYQRILQSRESTIGTNHPSTAHALYNLAHVYFLKRDFARADSFYRRALQIREDYFGPDSSSVSEVLGALALLLAERGNVAEALQLQKRVNSIDERHIGLNLGLGSERQKLEYLNTLLDRTNQSIFIQAEFAPDDALAADLAATTVLRQKGRVLDAVANNLLALRRRVGAEDQTLLDRFNKITKQLAELSLTGRETASLDEYRTTIKTLIDEREELEDLISRRAAGFYEKSAPVSLAAVQAVIPPDAALLEFAVFAPPSMTPGRNGSEARYIVYVLQNKGPVKWKDLGQAKQIDAAIDNFRQALRDPKRTDIATPARALDEKVMQPIRSLLGDAQHLLVSPDGELNLIPFEAMIDEKGAYLVEKYAFSYLTSGRDLLRMQVPRQSRTGPVVIADPAFGQPRAELQAALKKTGPRSNRQRSITAARSLSDVYFAQLVGSAEEGRSIRSFFPEAVLLTGRLATESALKQVEAPQVLHIATHGFFLENRPADARNSSPATAGGSGVKLDNPLLRSGLALAGANQRQGSIDDGILTALETTGLDLWGTKLVVLSACDTGLGEVRTGEGVYGLRRAFVLAGTESVVMSLWPVSDRVTRELMTGYYANLKQGLGRGASLRRVQLEMIKKGERRHPFYWAAFIQSGEWAALQGRR